MWWSFGRLIGLLWSLVNHQWIQPKFQYNSSRLLKKYYPIRISLAQEVILLRVSRQTKLSKLTFIQSFQQLVKGMEVTFAFLLSDHTRLNHSFFLVEQFNSTRPFPTNNSKCCLPLGRRWSWSWQTCTFRIGTSCHCGSSSHNQKLRECSLSEEEYPLL